MVITFDPPKRETNLRLHGIDFAHVRDGGFDFSQALVTPSYSGSDGRFRFKAVGILAGRIVVVVFSPLGSEAISLISVRRANAKERRAYAESENEQH